MKKLLFLVVMLLITLLSCKQNRTELDKISEVKKEYKKILNNLEKNGYNLNIKIDSDGLTRILVVRWNMEDSIKIKNIISKTISFEPKKFEKFEPMLIWTCNKYDVSLSRETDPKRIRCKAVQELQNKAILLTEEYTKVDSLIKIIRPKWDQALEKRFVAILEAIQKNGKEQDEIEPPEYFIILNIFTGERKNKFENYIDQN
ncbi:MAG: hypothetical protein ABSF81_12500 [Bacteroidales bacterium]|jgi:hypothetical protein